LAGLPGNKFLTKNLFQQFFKMKTFATSSSNNIFLFFMKFLIGNTRVKHNQLSAIMWNFYFDAKNLFQKDNCIIITSN